MIRILHVDDEPDLGELTASVLELQDDRFDVVSETTANDALERVATDTIDCVVSDYQMPGMDGLDFLAAVREREPDVPFILFTQESPETVASEAFSAGATDYVQKSGSSGQYTLLAKRITNAVEHYRSQQRETYLEYIHTVVHEITQTLTRASSRDKLEQHVCETIDAVPAVRFVAISEIDHDRTRLTPRAWVAAGDEEFTDINTTAVEPFDRPRTPHEAAIAEHDVALPQDIQADPAFAQWRETVRENDVCSLVVPLRYDDTLYGLLTIYAAQRQSLDDEIRTTVRELGDNIAYALNTLEIRTRLAEREASYRTLTEAASDAIITIDASNTIVYANPAVEQLFGYTPEELRGSSLSILIPDQFGERHHDAITRYLRTGERSLDWGGVELVGQHRDGTAVPFSISFGEFELHGQRFFTGILRDITQQKRREMELQRQNERLDEFAGIVAHDLRNPLNVVEGRIELAQDECDSDHLDDAMDALGRTDTLIRDLLTFARQGQPIGETEPVSLTELATQAMIDDESLRVETDSALDPIVGDESRIQQLLENLFRNAVEHGGEDVTVQIERLTNGFAVEDDGPGIPVEKREKVFEHGYTSTEEGTGFGLSIVKTIANAHGWQIEVTEGRDGGARFEITGVQFAY